ncbi:ketohexokinase-like [Argiope bruennichi]|uniref:Ketohexokinase like protein n=1 Tax=Argiope bruennichi TaxID=94029 RepID=A0A8T0DYK9_ARGBR|nr:ketohexokinase-like [Argiope bruennichi]KAF8763608.1 Ketohexokinase like protein [Argiope bruennichi]
MSEAGDKVLCVGLCCLDIVMFCKSYPLEDSDQRCLYHRWQRGGNASNNCTIFAEFKFPCEILGTLSNDIGGQFMKKNFKEYGIPIDNCRVYEEYESPISTIWINLQNGSRTIVHSNKNMPEVSFDNFKNLNLRNYSWIHFECRPQYDEMKKMIQFIRNYNSKNEEHSITISIEIEKPNYKLLELVDLGDIVFISKDFASACGFSCMLSAVENLSSKLGPRATVICAWGDQGACAKTVDGEVVSSGAFPPPEIVCTLGAGDTFVAATIMALCRKKSLAEAIKIGCQVAGARCGMSDSKGLGKLFPSLFQEKLEEFEIFKEKLTD